MTSEERVAGAQWKLDAGVAILNIDCTLQRSSAGSVISPPSSLVVIPSSLSMLWRDP